MRGNLLCPRPRVVMTLCKLSCATLHCCLVPAAAAILGKKMSSDHCPLHCTAITSSSLVGAPILQARLTRPALGRAARQHQQTRSIVAGPNGCPPGLTCWQKTVHFTNRVSAAEGSRHWHDDQLRAPLPPLGGHRRAATGAQGAALERVLCR